MAATQNAERDFYGETGIVVGSIVRTVATRIMRGEVTKIKNHRVTVMFRNGIERTMPGHCLALIHD